VGAPNCTIEGRKELKISSPSAADRLDFQSTMLKKFNLDQLPALSREANRDE
jgi:hypothetical protein